MAFDRIGLQTMASAVAACFLAMSFDRAFADPSFSRQPLDEFLVQHCAGCHADGADEGGFDLDKLGDDLSDPATFHRWVRIFDRVRLGEMPPEDAEPVPADDIASLVRTLEPSLHQAHSAAKGTVLRRLNRREYSNTINDIFGTQIDLVPRLPEDGRSHEFDNVGEALGLSMVHLQQYLDAADAVIDAATAKTAERPEVTTIEASYAQTREGEKFIGSLWKQLPDGSVVFFKRLGYPTGMLRGSDVKQPGRYRIRITGYAHQSDRPVTIRVGGTSFARGSEKPTYGYAELPPLDDNDGRPTTIEMTANIGHRYMIEIDPWILDKGILDKGIMDTGITNTGEIDLASYNLRKQGVEGYPGPGVAITKVQLIGPILESFPSRGHELLYRNFTRTPKPKRKHRDQEFELTSDDPIAAARQTLTDIATIALRRPVPGNEVSRYVDLFAGQLEQGESMESSLRTATAAIFCSPDFLFLQENDRWLDDHAIAARLSYFLTRTAPDADLRRAAAAGSLANDPDELLRQTRRLLDDPRNERFVIDFCDAWLNLRDIEFTSPDQQLFPEYDEFLQYSMLGETRAFVTHLIDRNLPVTNVVRSDFAMLNERLANHYGINGVRGPQLRPVSLPTDSLRGGLLSQGAVLKVSANGTNTSPVVRGVYVMERILADPPQPPPPSVPGVEPDIRGATTLRELLDRHRDLDSCRACHAKIDPPGFALECFNPIGGYREWFRSLGEGEKVTVEVNGRKVRYRRGPPVDATGALADGTRFDGFQKFRDLLADQPRVLATALVTKLLTFATGREMGFSDRPMIARIVDRTANDGYRVRDLIEQVVLSEAFRHR
ncbi:MAG: DUF1592 domain-containing protein [Planctomycetota bacterium]